MNEAHVITGSNLTKKSVLLNKFDTYFNLNLVTNHAPSIWANKPQNSWNSLDLSIYQRTDVTFSNKITFNTVTKQDLLNLAAAFSELAATIKE